MSEEHSNKATQAVAAAALRPFGKLWPFLKYSFIASIIVETALMVSNLLSLQFFQKMADGAFETNEALMRAASMVDIHQGVTGILYTLIFIVAVVAYCRFYYRAMNNLYAAGAEGLRTTPFWTVGAFFLPIINLWRPLTAVRQIWRGTFDPASASVRVPAIIGWWWFFWIIENSVANESFRMMMQSGGFGDEIHDMDMYMGSLALDIASAPLSIAAALLVLVFSKQILDGQNRNIIGGR